MATCDMQTPTPLLFPAMSADAGDARATPSRATPQLTAKVRLSMSSPFRRRRGPRKTHGPPSRGARAHSQPGRCSKQQAMQSQGHVAVAPARQTQLPADYRLHLRATDPIDEDLHAGARPQGHDAVALPGLRAPLLPPRTPKGPSAATVADTDHSVTLSGTAACGSPGGSSASQGRCHELESRHPLQATPARTPPPPTRQCFSRRWRRQ